MCQVQGLVTWRGVWGVKHSEILVKKKVAKIPKFCWYKTHFFLYYDMLYNKLMENIILFLHGIIKQEVSYFLNFNFLFK